MLSKPLYKQLLKRIQAEVVDQKQQSFVAITKGLFVLCAFEVNHQLVRINRRDLDAAWPSIMRALGLVDDGTRTDTWTLGAGFDYRRDAR